PEGEAAYLAPWRYLSELGALVTAAVGGTVAAGAEDAAVRQIVEGRYHAANRVQLAGLPAGAQARHTAQKAQCVGMELVGEEALHVGLLHHFAGVHDAHTVAHAGHDAQ